MTAQRPQTERDTSANTGKQQVRKRSRPNAWRSCKGCKERKQRCELPEQSMLLDPSDKPLDEHMACTRCHIMAAPCLLDDYEKEPRIAIERRKRSRMESKQHASSVTEPQHFDQVSEAHQMTTSQDKTQQVEEHRGSISQNEDHASTNAHTGSEPIMSVEAHSHASTSAVPISAPSQDLTHISAPTHVSTTSSSITPSSVGHQSSHSATSTSLHTHPEDLKEFTRYTPRSRPMTLVSELSVRQPTFSASGTELYALVKGNGLDVEFVDDLIDGSTAKQLSVWCELHLHIWLPGLPVPDDIRRARRRGYPLASSVRLLEIAQYLVAIQHSSLASAKAMRKTIQAVHLARMVEALLSRCVLAAQRDIDAARAFELLVAFPLASAYVESGKTSKVVTIETNLLASIAHRIATNCRQEYLHRECQVQLGVVDTSPAAASGPDDSTCTAHEMDLGVQWCSTMTWDFCMGIGSDDVIRSYSVKLFPSVAEVEKLLNNLRKRPTPGARGLGQAFVLLRAYRLAHMVKSWEEITSNKPKSLNEEDKKEDCTSTEYVNKMMRFCRHFDETGQDVRALRYSWLENHAMPEAKMLLLWLDIEDAAWFNVFYSLAMFYALQYGQKKLLLFTPDYLVEMIQNQPEDDPVRKFVFKFGDDRLDTSEGLLSMTTNMLNLPSHERDFVFPTLCTAGYLMEACMLCMEIHATTAKYWHSLPRRHYSYVHGLQSVVKMLKRMEDVSEEEGGILQTSLRIVAGMSDIIGIWQRALTHARLAKSNSKLAGQVMPATDVTRKGATGMEKGADGVEHAVDTSEAETEAEAETDRGHVAGVDVGIPPLATDDEHVTLDHLLKDLFGSTQWADVLQSVERRANV